MCHLHVSVVLLCLAYRVFSCSLVFKAPHPYPPFFIFYFLYSLLYRFSTVLPVQCDGCWGRGWGRAFSWRAGHVAGLQVGRALGCSGCLGLSSAVPDQPPPSMFLGTQPPYVTKALIIFSVLGLKLNFYSW